MLRPRRERPLRRANSEGGLIGVGTVIAVAIGVFFVYLLLGAFEGDSDSFGEVPIPSTTSVELQGGEVDLFYAEQVQGSLESPSLAVPPDLGYTITAMNGESVRIDTRGDDVETTDSGVARVVAAAFVPDDGTYSVRVTSDEAARRSAPALTFGQSPFQAVAERFDGVVDELNGPTGIAAAAALGLLFLLPMLRRAAIRARD